MVTRWACGVLACAGAAMAQPAPDAADREAEMFGAPAALKPEAPSSAPPVSRDDAVFGNPTPPEAPPEAPPETPSRTIKVDLDPLTIGGRLWLRLDASVFAETDAADQPLAMPNLLDVYLDARPLDRVRAYASARFAYDPTVTADADGAAALLNQASNDASLNELWLRFDVDRRAFFTLGAQRVRWGTGRVWNPTDVLNRQRLDPLAPVDLRTGVPILRAEMPIDALNGSLTVVGQIDETNTIGQVGGAARLQMAGDGVEASLIASVRANRPLLLGADLSAGLGPFDVYGEALVSRGGEPRRWVGDFNLATLTLPRAEDRDDDWIVQAVGGVEWPISYGDNDLFVLGAEYLFNDAGYASNDLYPWLIAQGDFQPFYAGRHYLAAYAVLANPGGWDATSFVLTSVNNLSDGTGVARINISHAVRRRLFVEPYVAVLYGEKGGEFRFSGTFPDGEGGEVSIPPPMAQVGLWLRVGF
ncbi:MAG: hypothetical protein ACI9U2_004231 [Bradymonadia bacterium]